MRLLVGLILVCLTVSYSQTQFTGVQLNSLQSLLSYSSQIQGLVNQLNTVLPQLSGILSSSQLQSLNDQIVRLVTSQIGNKPTIDDIKQLIRPLLEQFVGIAGQSRIDFDTVLQQIGNAVVTALPSILFGLLGKREIAQVDDRSLDQVLSLINQLPISSMLTFVQTYLGAEKYQQLQNQLVSIAVTAAASNWNPTTISQAVQQLFTQFVPQLSLMRIDWEALGQAALNGVVSVLPTLLIGLIGKRDLSFDIKQILSQLPLQQLAQLLQVAMGGQNAAVFTQVRNMLQNFLPSYSVNVNFDDLAANFLNQLNSLFPSINQSILTAILG